MLDRISGNFPSRSKLKNLEPTLKHRGSPYTHAGDSELELGEFLQTFGPEICQIDLPTVYRVIC